MLDTKTGDWARLGGGQRPQVEKNTEDPAQHREARTCVVSRNLPDTSVAW